MSPRAAAAGARGRLSPLRSVPGGGKNGAGSPRGMPKKTKVEPYSLTAQQHGLIKEDRSNAKLWAETLKALKDGPVSPRGLRAPVVFFFYCDRIEKTENSPS